MSKQKKKKSDDYFSKIHYPGLSIVNPRTGEEFPLEKKWITDLKNLTPEQKKSLY